jgi:hypothetical protein
MGCFTFTESFQLEACSKKALSQQGFFVNAGLTLSANDASICSTKGPVQTSAFAQESPLA